MSLRTKIVAWFLLLSVVPLAAIVSYSYLSSSRALRQAVMSETWELAGGLREQMESTRAELATRVQDLHGLPWRSLLAASLDSEGATFETDFEEMLIDLAPYVDTLEFIPSSPEPSAAPSAPEVTEPPFVEADFEPLLIELEALLSVSPDRLADAWRTDDALIDKRELEITGPGVGLAAEALSAMRHSLELDELDADDRARL